MAFYQRKPDMIIRGGTIVDGTGKLPYYGDIAVIGDKIDYIGDLRGVSAPVEIDAKGKYVTPGFIDCHTHSDKTIFSLPGCENLLYQGITTQVMGNCGMTGLNRPIPEDERLPAGTVAAVLDQAEEQGFSTNTAWLCGHGMLRELAGVYTTDYTEEQFQIMEAFLREALEAGFIGLSTGLEFCPGTLCRPEEVERLALIAAEYDANYSSHMRDEGYYFLEAVEEFLNVIRKSGLRGTISHLNIKYDNGVPNDYLEMGMQKVRDAREKEQLNVYCDMIGQNFAPGKAMAMLPSWLYAEGWDKAKEILADPEGRERVRNDLDRYWRFLAKGQWDRILNIRCPYLPEVSVTPFAELVEKAGKPPVDVFLDVMMAAPDLAAAGSVGINGVVFHEQILIDSVVKDPIYMWMTDSSTYPAGKTVGAGMHNYMAMHHFLIRYVRELGVISIQDAIRKVGSMPAHHFRLEGRGSLEEGNFADINVFALEDLKINANFADPCVYSQGMDYVIVNGIPVIEKGVHNGNRPGHVLRHLAKK